MDRKTVQLVTAAAALATGAAMTQAAHAAEPAPAIPVAASYADLLQPIPNAVERLAALRAASEAEPQLIEAQYDGGPAAHHHHHHHHNHNRRWYRQHGYYWNGGAWMLRPRHHHHHHQYQQPQPHHHHNNY